MPKKLFGTDGIRGTFGQFPIIPSFVSHIGHALSLEKDAPRIVIGRDTRESGVDILQAMASGLKKGGAEVISIGIVPTNAVALATKHMGADFGIAITASHNPFKDNGIKIFSANGTKLTTEAQERLESRLDSGALMADTFSRVDFPEIDYTDVYCGLLLETMSGKLDLRGMRIVIDAAHGAGYRSGPQMLQRLGADVFTIGADPSGTNINEGYGATAPQELQMAVLAHRADIGIAFDGDADRLLIVDENGRVIDGDQIIARLTLFLRSLGRLRGDACVSTILSNQGLEAFLSSQSLALHRTPVGDRHVAEKMRELDVNVGGEPSGHFILSDCSTTGDGLLAALHILQDLSGTAERASQRLRLFDPMPQISRNIPLPSIDLASDEMADFLAKAHSDAASFGGRLLIRPSGTEPILRLMAEGTDRSLLDDLLRRVIGHLQAA